MTHPANQDKHHDHRKTEQIFEIGENLADFFDRVLDKIDFEGEINEALARIIELLEHPAPPAAPKVRITVRFGDTEIQASLEGDIKFMWTIPGTTPDTAFTLGPLTGATDEEGSAVTGFNPGDYAIQPPSSDNEGAVSFPSYDPTTNSGVAHFGTPNTDGSPNIANLRADVTKVSDGSVIGALVGTVNVPSGAATNLVAEGFKFEGIAEDVAPDPNA